MNQPLYADEQMMDVRRMRMTVYATDGVMKMRRVIGLQSVTHRFHSAPPQCLGNLQSLEKQERLNYSN